MTFMRTSTIAVLAVTSGTLAHAQTPGKDWPAKPIIFIYATAPGGSDVLLRMHTDKMTQATGWQFIIDYKPGASGNIAASYVLKQPADGYTVLNASSSLHLGEIMEEKPPFDGWKEFVLVYQTYRSPQLLVAQSTMPFRTTQEFIAYAKANPGKLNWGTNGLAGIQRLVAEMLLRDMGNLKVTFVPYKGTGPVFQALAAGEVDISLQSPHALIPMVKQGKLRALGISKKNARMKELPDVTSIAEQGVPFDHYSWSGFYYRTATPPPIVNALNVEFNKASRDPEIRAKYETMGEGIGGGTVEEHRQIATQLRDQWSKVARDLNLRLSGD